MTVAAYLRVSTDEQRERQSINTQREFAERYSALHGLQIYHIYADDGVSGTVPLERRPEGSQILTDAKLGKFDQLLIYKLDRLGRDTRLILNAVAELEKLGVRIRSMTEEFDTGTSTGRLMLTMLSGFASHEREVIRERSVAGTLRVAETGAWLGGIVPYGYRKEGEKRAAHLVVSEGSIPGLVMSEADVIREVFRMSAVERKSCRTIAARLNELGIPCAYVRDDRLMLRGKRKQRTSGTWRPGRVRGLITNKVYMGVHEYGKRTISRRPLITRAVPAIVTEQTWKRAQANLKAHMLFGKRNARNQYLLRGLIKCGLCGLTYVGIIATRPKGTKNFYYRCNGAHSPSVYSQTGRCQSKPVRGDILETQVWSDIEAFLRNPSAVLQQLHTRLESETKGSEPLRQQIGRLERLLEHKATERNRVVGLFRRGRLTDTELDAQMDEICKEQSTLESQLEDLRGKIAGADSITASIGSAESLLARLRERLDQPLTWEQKRRLVEVLVAGGRVETTEVCGVKQNQVTVTYRFSQPDQALPLVLPQSYTTTGVIRIPLDPKTIGDHIRRRRLSLKLLQKDVAARLGVDQSSVFNWESNASSPRMEYMPSIIQFLGYNPLPQATGWADKLVRHRTSLGLTQKESAQRLGVDPATVARWERGEREPTGALLERLNVFLHGEQDGRSARRRVG